MAGVAGAAPPALAVYMYIQEVSEYEHILYSNNFIMGSNTHFIFLTVCGTPIVRHLFFFIC